MQAESRAYAATRVFEMESAEFILIVASFAVVLGWYLQNMFTGSEGLAGLLALVDDPETSKAGTRRKSYRIKERLARQPHELRDSDGVKTAAENAKPAFRMMDKNGRMRRRFRHQDDVRYRIKDKAAAYSPAPDGRDDSETNAA